MTEVFGYAEEPNPGTRTSVGQVVPLITPRGKTTRILWY